MTAVVRPLIQLGIEEGQMGFAIWTSAFFITYILMVNVVLMNVAVAVLLEGFLSSIAETDMEVKALIGIREYAKISGSLDPLTASFSSFDSAEQLRQMIRKLFKYLDVEASDSLSFLEFKMGLETLKMTPALSITEEDWDHFTGHGKYLDDDQALDAIRFEECMRQELKAYSQRIISHQMRQAIVDCKENALDYLAHKMQMAEVYAISNQLSDLIRDLNKNTLPRSNSVSGRVSLSEDSEGLDKGADSTRTKAPNRYRGNEFQGRLEGGRGGGDEGSSAKAPSPSSVRAGFDAAECAAGEALRSTTQAEQTFMSRFNLSPTGAASCASSSHAEGATAAAAGSARVSETSAGASGAPAPRARGVCDRLGVLESLMQDLQENIRYLVSRQRDADDKAAAPVFNLKGPATFFSDRMQQAQNLTTGFTTPAASEAADGLPPVAHYRLPSKHELPHFQAHMFEGARAREREETERATERERQTDREGEGGEIERRGETRRERDETRHEQLG
jgi:hypothetical protein